MHKAKSPQKTAGALAADAKKAATRLRAQSERASGQTLASVTSAMQILGETTKLFSARQQRIADQPAKITTDLAAAIQELSDASAQRQAGPSAKAVELALATSVKMLASMSGGDECRMARPFETMRRVRKADGTLVWTCDHDPPHEYPA